MTDFEKEFLEAYQQRTYVLEEIGSTLETIEDSLDLISRCVRTDDYGTYKHLAEDDMSERYFKTS